MHGAIQAVTRRRESESGEVELTLLSGFELRTDGAVVTLPMSSQRLLAFLALHHKPLHRLHVAGRLLIDAARPCDDQDLSDEGLSADLLPDWYDDWLLLEQERFRQLRMHALEALC